MNRLFDKLTSVEQDETAQIVYDSSDYLDSSLVGPTGDMSLLL